MTILNLPCPAPGLGPQEPTVVIGVVLSVFADLIIAVSLFLQKLAHNRNVGTNGKPVKPYTQIPMWWCGIVLNATGEIGNLIAYGFAPASIVAPVGSVGVFFNAVLATVFLKEPMRRRDMVGLAIIVAGIVLIILGVPEVPGHLTAPIVVAEVLPHPRCYLYMMFLAISICVLLHLAPKHGERHVLWYLMLCSLISSVTVIVRCTCALAVPLLCVTLAASQQLAHVRQLMCVAAGGTPIFIDAVTCRAAHYHGRVERCLPSGRERDLVVWRRELLDPQPHSGGRAPLRCERPAGDAALLRLPHAHCDHSGVERALPQFGDAALRQHAGRPGLLLHLHPLLRRGRRCRLR